MDEVTPQHLNRVAVRTLTDPLQEVDFLLLKPFRCGRVTMLWIVVLLHQAPSVELQLVSVGLEFSCKMF